MAQQNLEQIASKEFIELAKGFGNIDRAIKRYSKDPTDGEALAAYVSSVPLDIPPEMRQAMLEGMKALTPIQAVERMRAEGLKAYAGNIVDLMDTDYTKVIAGAKDDVLEAMVLGVTGTYKAIKEISEGLQEQDMNKVKGALINYTPFGKYKDWKAFIANEQNDNFIKIIAQVFTQTQPAYIFQKNKLGDEVEVKGKKAYRHNSDKMRFYLIGKLGVGKKKGADAYLGAAGAVYELEMEKQARREQQEMARAA